MVLVVNTSNVPANGINGRGKKRDAVVMTVGGRSVTAGEDVTNQVTRAPDTK